MSETAPTAVSGYAAAAQSSGADAPRPLARKGLLAAVASFAIWGLFPVYFKPLHDVPAAQIIANRIVWSCVLVFAWMLVRGELGKLRGLLTSPGILSRLSMTAVLISINWLVYVWAVGHGHVIEASLGYFINPLANVLLGLIVLRERLYRAQWIAVALVVIAVGYLAVATGAPPWIALTLAISFSLYGFMRKVISVEALPGLAIETLLLMPLAAGYLIWCNANGTGALGHAGLGVDALLLGCGPLTSVPLFLFAYGARLLPYSTMGLLLYLTPTLQLASGVFLYHEPFARARAFGFALIWLALLIYGGDGLWRARRPSISAGGA
jgi:chloramphenicol-sensitive protein RarD